MQLTEHSKNERGYSGVGRAIMRLLHNVVGVYTTEERFLNSDEWDNPGTSKLDFIQDSSCLTSRKLQSLIIPPSGVSFTMPSPSKLTGMVGEAIRLTSPVVNICYAVPSNAEIDFVLELLDKLGTPWLDKLDALLTNVNEWDAVARNDFCRFLQYARSIWNSLPTIIQLPFVDVPTESMEADVDVPELLFPRLDVNAG
jgi:proteasome activator subunit 4